MKQRKKKDKKEEVAPLAPPPQYSEEDLKNCKRVWVLLNRASFKDITLIEAESIIPKARQWLQQLHDKIDKDVQNSKIQKALSGGVITSG